MAVVHGEAAEMVETMLEGDRRDSGFLRIGSQQGPAGGIHSFVLDEIERRELLFMKENTV